MQNPFRKRTLDEPVPGTENTIWPAAAEWFNEMQQLAPFFSPRLAERVWVANRCIQLNAQQIASMPLKFFSTAPGGGYEPAWVSNPDPNWFSNGIGDAVFSIVKQVYGWGYAILIVSSRYASGFPQTWTVLDSENVEVVYDNGRRTYKNTTTQKFYDPNDIVQIDRNPGGLRGTSALRSYASQAWGVIHGGEYSDNIMSSGGIPSSVIKAGKKVTPDQAKKLQNAWMNSGRVPGAPAVLGPDLDFETLSFSPKDLMLLDAQKFNAQVVASAFGVPAFLLNLPMDGALVYQNPQSLGEFWWRFELRCTAKRIADAMTANLLPRGNAVLFEASDTFSPLTEQTNLDDSTVIKASPSDDVRPIPNVRPMMEVVG